MPDQLSATDVTTLIAEDAWMMRALRCVAREALPDWWIVAGFVRSKVWDVLHDHSERTPLGDIDVVFFDRSLPPAADPEIESRLRAREPSMPWEVCNQAHMHTYNHDAPCRDSIDAFQRWAETVSTIGVRLDGVGQVELAAPHGIDDLVRMIVRPTPHPDAHRDVFERRLADKGWRQRWPRLRIVRGTP